MFGMRRIVWTVRYPRRAHMSALLEELDEGDTLHAQSDSVVTASGTAIMSCFELGDNLPAFKVVNTEAFEFVRSVVYAVVC